MKYKVIDTPLVKGVYVEQEVNWSTSWYKIFGLENVYKLTELKNVEINKNEKLSKEEEIYVQYYELKQKGEFAGEVLTPSQLMQLGDYCDWRVLPVF